MQESFKSSDCEKNIIGPALPQSFLKDKSTNESDKDTFDGNKVYGPALPPKIAENMTSTSNIVGPTFLSDLQHKPFIDESEQDEEEIYGPLPPGSSINTKAQTALEERALEIKLDKLKPSDVETDVREEWMLELPDIKIANVLGARQFRSKERPDMSNRSSWTDTPNLKHKLNPGNDKVDLKMEAQKVELHKRDLEQAKISRKHKRNKESLLETHQKKLKQQKEETKTERRPFNREIDLQVNKFDDARKAAVLKKSEILDSKFSKGEQNYL